MRRYLIIKAHDRASWGVVDTLGLDEHPEQACPVIAAEMDYSTAVSLAYFFEHEWTVA